MPHPFLPKLKTGPENAVAIPAQAGIWNDEQTNTRLNNLAKAIDVPPARHRIYSIPDPWARIILFDRALFDSDHTLHPLILGEWRGLLAIIGLKERRRFAGLSVHAVDLNSLSGRAGSFGSVVSNLRPASDDLIDSNTTWDTLHILRWLKQPHQHNRPRAFAMTSPLTLVATGADYGDAIGPDEVPWFNNGVLEDPAKHLGTRERHALSEWILLLKGSLDAFSKSARRGWLVQRLEKFAKDLDATAQPRSAAEVASDTPLGFNHGVFRILDRPRRAEAEVVTDVAILTDQAGVVPHYLIEPSLAHQWNQPDRDITVFRDVSLATSRQYTHTGMNFGALSATPKVNWCTAAFFFSDRLIYERNDADAFPGCLPVKSTGDARKRYIPLPLNPEITKLFTARYLAENFSIEWLPDGGATCRLKLFLRSSVMVAKNGQQGEAEAPGMGADGKSASNGNAKAEESFINERACIIQRTYRDDEMVRVNVMPPVAIWPNFVLRGVDWKSYFLFQSWGESEKEELSVRPVVLEEGKSRRHNLSGTRFEVFRLDSFPEVLVCQAPYDSRERSRTVTATGLLLVAAPQPVRPPLIGTVALGVDFGSTGTDLYYRNADEKAKSTAVVFQNRLLPITGQDENEFRRIARYLFIPAKAWSAENILSVFQDFGDPEKGDRVALQDGHVLYAENPKNKFVLGDPNRVISNLKWGSERERIAALDFLMQLCLQAVAELAIDGANPIDVRFSYPTAFSNQDRTRFESIWNRVVQEIRLLTGLDVQLNPTKVDNREAVAATRFFADSDAAERMDVSGGALTIDIGGGTTDLAIWNKFKLLSHSSIYFAGRDIFLAPLRKKPEILTFIYPEIGLEELKKQKESAFNAQLDNIVAHYGSALINALTIKESDQRVRDLLRILELGLCGIGFYAGLLVARLIEADAYKVGRRISTFIGGNGSNLFKWCALGRFSEGTEIYSRFAQSFKAAAELSQSSGAGAEAAVSGGGNAKLAGTLKDTRIDIALSSRPKSEVAYGLVAPGIRLIIDENFTKPLAGESFRTVDETTYQETRKTWKDSPGLEEIRTSSVAVDRDFPVFKRFLASIDEDIDDYMLDSIAGDVDTHFQKLSQTVQTMFEKDPRAKGDHLLRNEPVFIVALKRLLDMRIDEWARRV